MQDNPNQIPPDEADPRDVRLMAAAALELLASAAAALEQADSDLSQAAAWIENNDCERRVGRFFTMARVGEGGFLEEIRQLTIGPPGHGPDACAVEDLAGRIVEAVRELSGGEWPRNEQPQGSGPWGPGFLDAPEPSPARRPPLPRTYPTDPP